MKFFNLSELGFFFISENSKTYFIGLLFGWHRARAQERVVCWECHCSSCVCSSVVTCAGVRLSRWCPWNSEVDVCKFWYRSHTRLLYNIQTNVLSKILHKLLLQITVDNLNVILFQMFYYADIKIPQTFVMSPYICDLGCLPVWFPPLIIVIESTEMLMLRLQ